MSTPTTAADRAQQKAEQDAVLARVNLSKARDHKFLASWVLDSGSGIADEEDDIEPSVRDVPDTAGLGVVIDKNNAPNGPLEELKKRILGNKASLRAKFGDAGKNSQKQTAQSVLKRRFGDEEGVAETPESDEEEEGRTAAINSKKRKVAKADAKRDDTSEQDEVTRKTSKKSASFLDQVLAERAAKKKGKKKTASKT